MLTKPAALEGQDTAAKSGLPNRSEDQVAARARQDRSRSPTRGDRRAEVLGTEGTLGGIPRRDNREVMRFNENPYLAAPRQPPFQRQDRDDAREMGRMEEAGNSSGHRLSHAQGSNIDRAMDVDHSSTFPTHELQQHSDNGSAFPSYEEWLVIEREIQETLYSHERYYHSEENWSASVPHSDAPRPPPAQSLPVASTLPSRPVTDENEDSMFVEQDSDLDDPAVTLQSQQPSSQSSAASFPQGVPGIAPSQPLPPSLQPYVSPYPSHFAEHPQFPSPTFSRKSHHLSDLHSTNQAPVTTMPNQHAPNLPSSHTAAKSHLSLNPTPTSPTPALSHQQAPTMSRQPLAQPSGLPTSDPPPTSARPRLWRPGLLQYYRSLSQNDREEPVALNYEWLRPRGPRADLNLADGSAAVTYGNGERGAGAGRQEWEGGIGEMAERDVGGGEILKGCIS
ncbi:hypothetical protein MMC13_008255 [Lambiella insularis]|nr:hypothetical protein [Lambiella insularis]